MPRKKTIPTIGFVAQWSHRAGASVARLPRSLLTGDVLEQVAEGKAVLVAVVAPCRAGIASLGQLVVVHDGPGVARPGEAGDLEPGGPAAVFAARRIEVGVRSAVASKFDCFYVYPTASLAETGNSGLAVTTLEVYIADERAAPFSQVCDVWAPVYRSQTGPSVAKGLAGNEAVMRSTFTVAYDSAPRLVVVPRP